jgi:transcriptional regulator GlxA family with amidase domain
MKTSYLSLVFLAAAARSMSAGGPPAPRRGPVTVAFVVTSTANVMDFAGPWEVFQDVMLPELGGSMEEQMPFRLYTVSDSREPVEMTGGLRVVPEHTFADAPKPDIVVVGAQRGSDAMLAWLKKESGEATVMSVCTGAFKLAKAGLLDGLPATTHHDFFDRMTESYPKVKLQKGLRWVQASERLYTAGGLTSGIDLALHLVARLYGDSAAERTAFYMEHAGDGWKTPTETPARSAK